MNERMNESKRDGKIEKRREKQKTKQRTRETKINKYDGVQTSDAFWRSARVLVSEMSFKWYYYNQILIGFLRLLSPLSSGIKISGTPLSV